MIIKKLNTIIKKKMEQIYPPTYFDCTEKLTDLEEYFQSFAELSHFASQEELNLDKEELIAKKFNELPLAKDKNLFNKTSKSCSINSLSVPGEMTPVEVFNFSRYTMKLHQGYGVPKEAEKLETVKAKANFEKIVPRKKEFENVVLKPNISTKQDVLLNDTLVFIRIYQPFSATVDKRICKKGEKSKCSHEIVTLSRNTLSDVRDKILCANDNGLSLEIDDLKTKAVENVKEEYPSGLIGINDVLYVDMRHPKSIDYSEVIKQWGINKNVGNFIVLQMDKVEIKDINYRLGYPYIYQHHGNCEHLLVFSDVRLIKKSDPLCFTDYPYYRNINRYNCEQCNICHAAIAKWVCCECDRLPHDRTFLCQDCFVSYNYIGAEKIGNFKAYPYYNKSSVL